MENKLDVYFNGRIVGTIAKLNNKYAFQYDDNWIKDGFSISLFSLPLKKELFIPNDMTFNGFLVFFLIAYQIHGEIYY